MDKDKFEIDVKKLDDRLKSSFDKKDIPIPDEFDSMVEERLRHLNSKKLIYRRVIAIALIVLLTFVGGVRYIPQFASYASSIPGLKDAVNWIRGDKGIQSARDRGYSEVPEIVIREDDYTLSLSNIFIDEDRIRLTAVLVDHTRPEGLNNDTVRVATSIYDQSYENDAYLNLYITFPDFDNSMYSTMFNGGDTHNTLVRDIEKALKKDELQRFIDTNPSYLTLKATINNGGVTHIIDIELPLDISKIEISKRFGLNNEILFDYGTIKLKELTISPTRMRLDVEFDMLDGYFFTGFDKVYLVDKKAKYSTEGLVSTTATQTERTFYFVPSLYFEELPNELKFGFDGIRIGSIEGKSFLLNLNDVFPKSLSYMGEEIIINKFLYENQNLIVDSNLPNNTLKVQGFDFESHIGNKSFSEQGNDTLYRKDIITTFYNAEKKEIYELSLSFPGYLVPLNREVPLDFN
ncbi:uncharacterized protein DUF4179 [Natranaerovirga pectinivora]|uniref:Uncharacterized protein DUF4179 n=1 Tax=Natranaerovirga pectinivora TaxID=682400 RepID=A0A4R3MLV6_9FIRM|nr:DUF4179 domain-containing protein [Natranaerovirga pectinivora]TCT12879.1 uncharacterized protein DUF4179 [Natranaerovirga pectinivora]